MIDTLPKKFGRFVLLKKLGQGGMGTVFKAMYSAGQEEAQTAAIKLASKDVTAEALMREGELLAKVWAPQVERLIESGESDGRKFLAKEYVAGVTLAEIIAMNVRGRVAIPPELVLYIAGEIAIGLRALHSLVDPELGGSQQLLHGDLNPANVLIGFDGSVKLIDLGLSRFAGRPFSPSQQVEWLSLRYSSPDRILHKRLSASDDIFALGMIIWELVTGKNLWADLTTDQITALAVNFNKPDLGKLSPQTPRDITRLVESCIATQGFAGFYEAAEVEEAIRSAANDYRMEISEYIAKKFMSSVYEEEIRRIEIESSMHQQQFQHFKNLPAAAVAGSPQSTPTERPELAETVVAQRARTPSVWPAKIWRFVRPVAIALLAEATILTAALSSSQALRAAWKNSDSWTAIVYMNRILLSQPIDFIVFLKEQALDQPAHYHISTLKIVAEPRPAAIELDGEFAGDKETRELSTSLEHPTLLTLKLSGYDDLNIIIDHRAHTIRADFPSGRITAE